MNADDLLFEPLSGPSSFTTKSAVTGIDRRPDRLLVKINPNEPLQPYLDAAEEVIKHCLYIFPNQKLLHPRAVTGKVPTGALNMMSLTERFHNGMNAAWMSRSRLLKPTLVHFDGCYGYVKYFKLPTVLTSAETGYFYQLGSDLGLLALMDLGLICVHETISAYHWFTNEIDAENWYKV